MLSDEPQSEEQDKGKQVMKIEDDHTAGSVLQRPWNGDETSFKQKRQHFSSTSIQLHSKQKKWNDSVKQGFYLPNEEE